MDLTGLCDLCGKTGKLFTCMLCGKRTCLGCFALNSGLCKNCMTGRRTQDNAKTLR